MCALAEPTFYVRVASVQNFPNFHVESTQKPFVNAILLECTFKKVIRTPFTLQNPAKKQSNHTLNRCCWCLLSIFLIFAKNRINRRKKCEFFIFIRIQSRLPGVFYSPLMLISIRGIFISVFISSLSSAK